MIFVTAGTNETPFDRLVGAVESLPDDEEVVVQHGSSSIRPANARCVDFVVFDEFVALVREADRVVTHAGAGSVLVAIGQGKRPLVVPRLRRLGEAVDDHQLAFGRRLEALGLVTLVEDERTLAQALGAASAGATAGSLTSAGLADDLRAYLRSAVAYSR